MEIRKLFEELSALYDLSPGNWAKIFFVSERYARKILAGEVGIGAKEWAFLVFSGVLSYYDLRRLAAAQLGQELDEKVYISREAIKQLSRRYNLRMKAVEENKELKHKLEMYDSLECPLCHSDGLVSYVDNLFLCSRCGFQSSLKDIDLKIFYTVAKKDYQGISDIFEKFIAVEYKEAFAEKVDLFKEITPIPYNIRRRQVPNPFGFKIYFNFHLYLPFVQEIEGIDVSLLSMKALLKELRQKEYHCFLVNSNVTNERMGILLGAEEGFTYKRRKKFIFPRRGLNDVILIGSVASIQNIKKQYLKYFLPVEKYHQGKDEIEWRKIGWEMKAINFLFRDCVFYLDALFRNFLIDYTQEALKFLIKSAYLLSLKRGEDKVTIRSAMNVMRYFLDEMYPLAYSLQKEYKRLYLLKKVPQLKLGSASTNNIRKYAMRALHLNEREIEELLAFI
jgi:hypothetical protein